MLVRSMIDSAGSQVLRRTGRSPHGTQLTLARSVIAFSTLLTLVFNDSTVLLHSSGRESLTAANCSGLSSLGGFCLVDESSFEMVRLALIVLCIPAFVGIVPMMSAPLYAYSAFTLSSNTVGIEGGDQLATNLAVLLSIVCLTDKRINGWAPRSSAHLRVRYIPANILLTLCLVQIAYVYFEAASGKQSHPLWAEGSALWYWTQQTGFGARSEVQNLLIGIFSNPVLSHVATWGVILYEYSLAVLVLCAHRRNSRLGVVAFATLLHLVFAIVLGLISFGITMFGSIVLIMWRSYDAMPWQIFRCLQNTQIDRSKSRDVVR